MKILYKGADIIILDEPTAVLTPQGVEGLFTAIRGLKEKEKTIILITHKLKEVMLISDCITVLKNGKVTGNLDTIDANENILANLMVGREVLFNTKKNEKNIGNDILVVNNLYVNNDDNIEKVKDVSFSVKKGEIVGEILYKNVRITKAPPKMHRILKMGYVPEDRLKTASSSESNLIDNNLGWDGVMIVSIAKKKPIAVVIISFFGGMLKSGSFHIERVTETNRLVISILQALFVLFVAVDYNALYKSYLDYKNMKNLKVNKNKKG